MLVTKQITGTNHNTVPVSLDATVLVRAAPITTCIVVMPTIRGNMATQNWYMPVT